jgi:DNA-binding MarR family transcriptional regulator/N-acetylglutamate synthase-like GNAT family acetyltransferase
MLTNKNNLTSWTNDSSLANRLKSISNYLSSGSRKVFKNISNDFEQSSFNVLTLISLKGPLSIKQISYYLKVTHPAIIQIVKKLIKKKFVVKYDSLEDKRKTIVSVTDDGKKAYESIKGIANKIEQSYQDIINEVDPKFLVTLSLIEDELESKGILERVSEKSKEEQINLEWLNKYFEVEEEDTRALEDPESYYIKNGGEIFFAIMDNNVAGTCAVKKINRKLFELSKMAVSELYQGKQIGKKLALTAIGFAYEKGAHKINLETSPKLKAAINLYKKLGFEILPEMYPTNYKRTLFEMELKLR